MTVERRIYRKYEETSPDFTFIQSCFTCPVVSTGCSFCFPPWCARHATLLSSVETCECQTEQRVDDYPMLLKMMTLEELIQEATTIGLEVDGFVDMAANERELLRLWYAHCGDINQVKAEAERRWASLPLRLRLILQSVEEKEDRLLSVVCEKVEQRIRKREQPREEILI